MERAGADLDVDGLLDDAAAVGPELAEREDEVLQVHAAARDPTVGRPTVKHAARAKCARILDVLGSPTASVDAMVRECVRLCSSLRSLCPGCSLILDFSDSAAAADAMTDAPYTQAQCDYKEPNDSSPTAAMVDRRRHGPRRDLRAATAAEDHDFYKFTRRRRDDRHVAIQFTNRPAATST